MKKYLVIAIIAVIVIGASFAGLYALNKNHPTPPVSKPNAIKPYIDEVFDKMSFRDKIASLFIFHAPGIDATAMRQFVDTYHPGGMILMGDNIPPSDVDLRTITSTLQGENGRLPRFVAIDQEGGSVSRLKADTFPSAETLKSQYLTETYNAFSKRSRLVQSMGVTLNFGIVADVTNDPDSFIYDRALGTTPQTASDNVRAAVNGTHSLTLSTLKHFPGHGETPADSHTTIPTTDISEAVWKQKDALPFEAGVQAGADLVMFGHLRYSAVDSSPASLSKKWHDMLRNELEFGGVTITDDMCMLQTSDEIAFHDPVANAVSAVQAGNTLLLYVLNNNGSVGSNIDPNLLIDGVLTAVDSGKVSRSAIEVNAKQALKLRAHTSSFVQTQ
jgi:beta-N-acetylhexosaminidase